MSTGITATWCRDKSMAGEAARFFAANVDPSKYASPSDYLAGRMNKEMTGWAIDFQEVLVHEFEDIAADNEHKRLAIAKIGEEIVAIAVILVVVSVRGSYCVIEDFVVRSDLRQRGLGRSFMGWLEASLMRRGIRHIFLEIASKNQNTVIFASNSGYAMCGVQMHKELTAEMPDETPGLGMAILKQPGKVAPDSKE